MHLVRPGRWARQLAVATLLIISSTIVTSTPFVKAVRPAHARTTANAAQQLRVFQQLWKLVNDAYVYPNFNGVDWKAKKAEVEAQINAGLSDLDFYLAMRRLIEGLHDGHSAYLPPFAAEEIFQLYLNTGDYEGVGLVTDLNREKGYLYVQQVVPGSSAERAGIQPHDHILMIGGFPAVDRDGYSQSFLLLGPAGSEVPITVQTPAGAQRSFSLVREKLQDVQLVDARLLPNTGDRKIGYLLIPTFFSPDIDQRAKAALQTLMSQAGGKLDGLVIDVRINSGGAIVTMNNTLNFLTKGNLGKFSGRKGGRTGLTARGDKVGNSQQVPLVVLIGPGTVSAGELFAGTLQFMGRARLVGQTSAGNIEMLRTHILDDGSLLFLAEQTFTLPNGGNWEGQGLQPIVAAPGAWDEITLDNDPAINAAVALLTTP